MSGAKSLFVILASVGIYYSGAVTDDAIAFAAAVESGKSQELISFIDDYPASNFLVDALVLIEKKFKLCQDNLQDNLKIGPGRCLPICDDPNLIEKGECVPRGKNLRSSYIY